jgi:hypothetical protein
MTLGNNESLTNGAAKYLPLSSVWEGSDGELLEAMLSFYPSIDPEPILDATYNTGRFWKGSSRHVWSMDINPKYKPKIVADNRTMEGVPSQTFGTVVYDPPHVGPQGRDKSVKRFDVDFGATIECGKQHDWSLSYLYPLFLKQAKRVLRASGQNYLSGGRKPPERSGTQGAYAPRSGFCPLALKPDGLILAKITDMVNSHRSRWAHCDFMGMAEVAGFTVCDLIVKIRRGPMMSNKWIEAHHARKRHCFWIICRNGDSCERQ